MRIVQLMPTVMRGDAIGNEALTLLEALKSAGHKTAVYAENHGPGLPRDVRPVSQFRDKVDLVIYHLSTGDRLNDRLLSLKSPCLFIYHNITPPHFWQGWDPDNEKRCREGLNSVRRLNSVPVRCIADSAFNRQDLVNMGYACPIDVVPVLLSTDDLSKTPDASVIRRCRDGKTNILFTGRVAPNKKQEDLISAFWYYRNYINTESRLILAGSCPETDRYGRAVRSYIKMLGLEKDVIVTGHIPFGQLLAYYQSADVFVCLSAHEGFCVPLVEAMYFDLPIIAWNSSAVGETLGDAGLLLDEKDPRLVAEAIDLVIRDKQLQTQLKALGRERLQVFDSERVKGQYLQAVSRALASLHQSRA